MANQAGVSDIEVSDVEDLSPKIFNSTKTNTRESGLQTDYHNRLQTHSQSQTLTITHSHSCQTQNQSQDDLPSVIQLNVGGYRFTTLLATLRRDKESMLAAMFSGRHRMEKDQQGAYFIDSNGAYFGYILDFLRHGTMPPNHTALAVYKEAVYYNIATLLEKLEAVPPVTQMLVREAHRSQYPDYQGVKDKVIRIAVENAAVNNVGEVLIHAFRKPFVPKAPYFNLNHDCVADTAHINVGPWESAADEDALIRCLENDLLEEGFNVKQHEQKKRCKYYNGQNCQKYIYKITLIFH